MDVQLVRLGPHSQTQVLSVTNDFTWTAGRGSDCQIYTRSRFASRAHFSIEYKRKEFYITDLGSSNGTYLNDVKLPPREEHPLPLDSVISVGVLAENQNDPDCLVYSFKQCKKNEVAHCNEDRTDSKHLDDVVMISDEKRQERSMESIGGTSFCELPTFSKKLKKEKIDEVTNEITTSLIDHTNSVVFEKEKQVMTKLEPIYENDTDESTRNKVPEVVVKKELEDATVLARSDNIPLDSERDMFEPEGFADDEIVDTFEAPTQVDEPLVRTTQSSYSMTEDIIEISDSEDEILNNIKMESGNINFIKPEIDDCDDYDDDIICLDIVKCNNNENRTPVPEIIIEDDYSETDVKWMNKLFKTKEECCSFITSQRENDASEECEEKQEWMQRITEHAKGIETLLHSKNVNENKIVKAPTESNEKCSATPETFLSDLGNDSGTFIGLLTVSHENPVEDPTDLPNTSISFGKRHLTEGNLVKQKRMKLNDRNDVVHDDFAQTSNVEMSRLDSSCGNSKKSPTTEDVHSKTNYLEVPERVKSRRSRKKIRRKGKDDALSMSEKQRIRDARKKKLRELSLRKEARENEAATKGKSEAHKVHAPLKVKITRKNRGEYLCHQIEENVSEVDGVQVSGVPEEKKEEEPVLKAKKEETITKQPINGVISTRCDAHKVPKINIDNVRDGKCEERVLSTLNEVGNGTNEKVAVRQENGNLLKGCLKKRGYDFLKSDRPIAPLKTVHFETSPNIRYYNKEHRISMKTSSLTHCKTQTLEKRMTNNIAFIKDICKWNAKWLEECKKFEETDVPPVFINLTRVEKKFRDHGKYVKTFIPLLLLELWHTVSIRWKASSCGMYQFQSVFESYTDLCSETEVLKTIKCKALAEVSHGIPLNVREGDLVILRIQEASCKFGQNDTYSNKRESKTMTYRIFGYLGKITAVAADPKTVHQSLTQNCSLSKPEKILELEILVHNRPDLFQNSLGVFQVIGVYNIGQNLLHCEAVCGLSKSPLCQTILSPNQRALAFSYGMNNEDIVFKGSLDGSQRELISKLISSCTTRDHNFLQIQGGPGTGKTYVILAFILQLLHTKRWKKLSKPKILYCAHSNIVVDDMAEKLQKYRRDWSLESKYTVIRYGNIMSMKSSVREISSTILGLKSDHDVYVANKVRTLNQKIDVLVEDLKICDMIKTVDMEKVTDEKSSQLHACVKERERLKVSRPVHAPGQRPTYTSERLTIENADVICMTCASSGKMMIRRIFEEMKAKDPGKKIICIIDEAMQCKESETIIPLQLGVTDLILVGDPRQLRSPSGNELAHSLGANQSLFWRMLSIFKDSGHFSPVFELNTQYRMNGAISLLPNKLFYNNALKDGRMNNNKYKIQNYSVLVDSFIPDDVEERLQTVAAKLVVEIVTTMANDIFDNNFGIITCHREQSKNLKFQLKEMLDETLSSKINVNPIESVQGQEFDIVLFIFNPNMDCPARANVALTRAKHSLIILTSNPQFSNNKLLVKLAQDAALKRVSFSVNAWLERLYSQ